MALTSSRDMQNKFKKTIGAAKYAITEAENICTGIANENHRLELLTESLQTRLHAKRKRDDDGLEPSPSTRLSQAKKPKHIDRHAFDTNSAKEVKRALSIMPPMPTEARPRGLKNWGQFCYSNSVLQGLATALHPGWLKESLGRKHIGRDVVDLLLLTREEKKVAELGERFDPHYHRVWGPIAAFLSVIDWARAPQEAGEEAGQLAAIDPYQVQDALTYVLDETFSTWEQQDAAEYLREILNTLSQGRRSIESLTGEELAKTSHKLVDKLFRVETVAEMLCKNSECQHAWRTTDEADWMLNLRCEERKVRHTSITELLYKRTEQEDVADFKCDHCGHRGALKSWAGIDDLPECLVVRFERITRLRFESLVHDVKLKYSVAIEPDLDLEHYAVHDTKRLEYHLRTVVKHIGEDLHSGHYIAYTQTLDGKWWKCNDDRVSASSVREISTDEGEVYLAFYQRLGSFKRDKKRIGNKNVKKGARKDADEGADRLGRVFYEESWGEWLLNGLHGIWEGFVNWDKH